MRESVKFIAGFAANQVLAHGVFVSGGWIQDAALRMKRRKKDARSSSAGAGTALERELGQALAAPFPASDRVAVDSAEEHRARLKRRKPRGTASRSPGKRK